RTPSFFPSYFTQCEFASCTCYMSFSIINSLHSNPCGLIPHCIPLYPEHLFGD
ncbi:Hypothetical protein FKW44_018034, partial [Caligus rogercresseyi]